MEDYKPNSHRFKEEQKTAPEEKKRVEKVVTGKAKVKKKNEISKLKDVFVSEDAHNVGSYIFMDVLVPAIKKAVSDIVRDGIDMILYGSSGRSKNSSSSSRVSYRSYYDDRNRDRDRYSSGTIRAGSGFHYDDIIFETRQEAEAAIDQMDEIIERYGFVTVADYYDMADLSAPYTSNKYGWTTIRNAEVVRAREGGYTLKLPKALPID